MSRSIPPTKCSVRERANSGDFRPREVEERERGRGRCKPKSVPQQFFPPEGRQRAGELQALVGTPNTKYFCQTEGEGGEWGEEKKWLSLSL